MRRMIGLALLVALAACGPRPEAGPETAPPTAAPTSPAAAPAPPEASPAAGGGTEALVRRLFPEAAQVVRKPMELAGHAGEDIGKILGQPLEGHDLESPALVATSSDGRSLGAAWQTDAHLSGGDATVVVGMGLDGKVVGVLVEGSPEAGVESPAFLGRFTRKTASALEDPGLARAAEGSSAEAALAVAAAVRRAAVVLKEGLIQPSQHSH